MVDWASHLLKINCVSKSSEVIFDLLFACHNLISWTEGQEPIVLSAKEKKKEKRKKKEPIVSCNKKLYKSS